MCVVDDKVKSFYIIWHHTFNVVNKNIFAWFFIYRDVIWIKIFDIDYQKLILPIFDISFPYPADLSTNMIKNMELLIHGSLNTSHDDYKQ